MNSPSDSHYAAVYMSRRSEYWIPNTIESKRNSDIKSLSFVSTENSKITLSSPAASHLRAENNRNFDIGDFLHHSEPFNFMPTENSGITLSLSAASHLSVESNRNSGDFVHHIKSFSSVPTKNLNKKEKRIQCPQCFKELSGKYALERHLDNTCGKIKNPNGPYKCNTCARRYKRKSSLKRHQKSECKKKRQFMCLFCRKFFRQKSCVKRHIEKACKKVH